MTARLWAGTDGRRPLLAKYRVSRHKATAKNAYPQPRGEPFLIEEYLEGRQAEIEHAVRQRCAVGGAEQAQAGGAAGAVGEVELAPVVQLEVEQVVAAGRVMRTEQLAAAGIERYQRID